MQRVAVIQLFSLKLLKREIFYFQLLARDVQFSIFKATKDIKFFNGGGFSSFNFFCGLDIDCSKSLLISVLKK